MADNPELTATQEDDVRQSLADVYTFVRSQEINRTIASFTFDHYIDEAKRQINGRGQDIRDAAGKTAGSRPTKLDALAKLKDTFNKCIQSAQQLAQAQDDAAGNS